MANEVILTTLSAKDINTGGSASVASNSYTTVGTYYTSQHSGYTGSDLVFVGTMAASIASASNYFTVYARPLDIDGTSDAPVPGSSFQGGFVGTLQFAGSGASGAQTAILQDVPNSWANVEIYIGNSTNAGLNSGWTMRAIPKTVKPL